MRVLLLEAEAKLAEAIVKLLKPENTVVDWRSNMTDAVDAISAGKYDCLLVDVSQLGKAELQLIQDTREMDIRTPILVISNRNTPQERVNYLNAGADDYLGKPFNDEELVARVNALVRRWSGMYKSDSICFGAGTLCVKSRAVVHNGQTVELSEKEFLLLERLVRNQGEVIPRDELICHIWGPEQEVADNALVTYVYFLRKKCTSIGLELKVHNVRGCGYRLDPQS